MSNKKKLMIAAFDFDWTLARPISDNILSKSKDDWTWLYSDTIAVLKALWKRGYSIVVITNQRKKYKREQVREAMKSVGIPHISIVIGEGKVVKPNKELFPFQLEEIDMSKSFYVGDAGGESYDWSDMDKEFAKNVGITYKRPEEVFRGVMDMSYGLDLGNPRSALNTHQEAIIMVGYPGSGKSTYVKEHLVPHGFHHIESDILKTKAKINKMIKESIGKGSNIVIDATNPSPERREEIREIIKLVRPTVKVTTIWMNTPRVVSWNRNIRREKRVPEIAYNVYASKLEWSDDELEPFRVYEEKVV